jgi:membrane protease YdiL (CAAX protease family)
MQRSSAAELNARPPLKRIAFIWLFGGTIGWTLQYLNRWFSPSTAIDNLPLDVAIGNVAAVVFFFLKWPEMFARSRVRPLLSDLATGLLAGYAGANIAAALAGRSAFENYWIFTNPHRKLTILCVALIAPTTEELIYRAGILGLLLERTSTLWAGVITITLAAVMHDSFWMAFPGQILLTATYLIRGRSLSSSIIAHVTWNSLIFFPSLLIVFHRK